MSVRPYVNSEFYHAIYHHLIGNVLLKETESPLILGVAQPLEEGEDGSDRAHKARAWVSS